MSVFDASARYYNLLYKDKDYAGEASYVEGLIMKYQPETKNILDLGCGTGMHDSCLAEKGYDVTGVDMSEKMLAVAKSDLSASFSASSNQVFLQGDIRNVRLNKTFDVVISLFHVMSYQITNDDLRSAFATARAHLNPDGIFIFDCWYGPAVLTDLPAVRIKRLEDDASSITRIAEPVIHPNENLVDVHYHIIVKNKSDNSVSEMREVHRMRYLFKPEIDLFLAEAGLHILDQGEWMTGRRAGFNTWGVYFVVRA